MLLSNSSVRQSPETQTAPNAVQVSLTDLNYDRTSWVNLHTLPNPYSFSEALLLCQESADHWRAWIPDHGEIVLDQSDFYC